jgi:hypothetical protein
MQPQLNAGTFVFSAVSDLNAISAADTTMIFKEQEGFTIITTKEKADELQLPCSYIASWITLTVHSSLEAVGLTAAFSTALANEGISCNVVAAFYHDHIFIDIKDTEKAMVLLNNFSVTP